MKTNGRSCDESSSKATNCVTAAAEMDTRQSRRNSGTRFSVLLKDYGHEIRSARNQTATAISSSIGCQPMFYDHWPETNTTCCAVWKPPLLRTLSKTGCDIHRLCP